MASLVNSIKYLRKKYTNTLFKKTEDEGVLSNMFILKLDKDIRRK